MKFTRKYDIDSFNKIRRDSPQGFVDGLDDDCVKRDERRSTGMLIAHVLHTLNRRSLGVDLDDLPSNATKVIIDITHTTMASMFLPRMTVTAMLCLL